MKTIARLLLAGVACVTVATAAEARPFTAKDMATLDRVSDPRVSPDGRWVVYALRTVDYDANKAAGSLWLADLTARGVAPKRLAVSDGGANTARWAPNGKSIYVLSSRSGSSQVWRAPIDGGAPVQVTAAPFDIGAFKLSPAGDRIIISQSVYPDCADAKCTADRDAANAARKTTGVVHDRLFVRHWDEWADGKRN
ncbi:MAG: S9 family peptidase, partial [Pseudomonadota bacterium]